MARTPFQRKEVGRDRGQVPRELMRSERDEANVAIPREIE